MEIERATLGDFMNVTCFLYLVRSAQELAGSALIVDAGRHRGSDIVHSQGLAGHAPDPEVLQHTLDDILGAQGTRLCLIQQVSRAEHDGYAVQLTECVYPQYAMGVFIGALGAMTGQTMVSNGLHVQDENTGTCHFVVNPF